MVFKLLHHLIPKMPHNNCCSWLMEVGYCLLFFVSVIATFVAADADFAQVASLTATNMLILTLFQCLGAFGQAAPPSPVAKFAVWFFSTSIMAVLTWSMTMEVHLLAKTIFWVLVAVTSIGTHYILFWHQPNECNIPPFNLCFCSFLIFVFFNSLAFTYNKYETNILTDRINYVIFEFASWLASLLLLWCIAAMEIAPHNSVIREWMKFGAWAFATMLAAMVISKAAEIFQWPMKYVAWVMVVASSFSSFYSFFFLHEAYLVSMPRVSSV